MKRLPAISLILIALLLISSFQNLPTVHGQTEDVNYFIRSTVTYANPSGNTHVWSFSEDDQAISLFMNNTWQTVELVNSTFPMGTKKDDDGNSVAVLQFPNSALESGKNVSFTVWYHIVSKPRTIANISEDTSGNLTDIPSDLRSGYTQEEGPWQTSNSTLQELAYNLTKNEVRVLSIIQNFVVWINENIKYPWISRHEVPFYPNQTYAQGEGDCDDQATLLITLCRIVGIPSYLQIGCIYLPKQPFNNATFWDGHVSMIERRIGWHGWAVVYVPPWGWLPVDLTYVRNNGDDPLSSVKSGAVTGQNTIQYLNVTHTDYVASSLEYRKFLTENGFNVYEEDEMILEVNQPRLPLFPLFFLALMVFLVATSVLLYRRWVRESVRRGTGF